MKQLQRLAVGQTAPNFECQDMTGNTIRLSDYADQKLLLCFFRYAGCPWCNLAIHRLTLDLPRLEELGLKVIAFIQSEPENVQRYILDRHQPKPLFPIIADPDRKIYDLYGVNDSVSAAGRSFARIPAWLEATIAKGFHQGKIDGNASLVPAHFLVGPYDLSIHKASYGNDYFQDWPMIEIMEFAQFGPA